jgi:hypothetical protein
VGARVDAEAATTQAAGAPAAIGSEQAMLDLTAAPACLPVYSRRVELDPGAETGDTIGAEVPQVTFSSVGETADRTTVTTIKGTMPEAEPESVRAGGAPQR